MNNVGNLANQLTKTSIKVDSTTGDYEDLNGQIANNNSLYTRIYQLLRTPVASWLYAPTKTYGSQFGSILNTRQRPTPNQLAQFVASALKPLTSTGDFTITSLKIPVYTLGTVILDIEGYDGQGNSIKYNINPLT